jgi:hypothetical protein
MIDITDQLRLYKGGDEEYLIDKSMRQITDAALRECPPPHGA